MIKRPARSARLAGSKRSASGKAPQRQPDARLTDRAIRVALRSRVRQQYRRASGTVLLEELGLCRGFARVDLAVVNGLMHGYEIKSDRDSLRRLSSQVEAYGKVFDRLTLVVGDRHVADAKKTLPSWWGVIRASSSTDGPKFQVLRLPKQNPLRDARALVELLWAEDAIALLEARGAARGVRGKPKRYLWDRIAQEVRIEVIAAAVRRQLKARAGMPSAR